MENESFIKLGIVVIVCFLAIYALDWFLGQGMDGDKDYDDDTGKWKGEGGYMDDYYDDWSDDE